MKSQYFQPARLSTLRSSVMIVLVMFFVHVCAGAHTIDADPSNYQKALTQLQPGDTLVLAAGIYNNGLSVNNINGTEAAPICIRGMDTATVFMSRSCCNTISITKSSYCCISHLRVEGNDAGVDALKAEGTSGNYAHHITVEYLTIHNFQSDQQVVGINTKCPCWNWIIRKNRILGAGTGLYLGNSNGDAPFVNGRIEYNYVSGTLGYSMEIKHQVQGVRDAFSGTAVDGKTVIAHNVFTKDSISSTGSLARPNLLVGGFAASGWGAKDYYEIYSNLIAENATEALFQGSGSMALYNNIFINHSDGDGARAVYITSQNNIQPRNVSIFHNTVISNNSAGAIRIYNADNAFTQQCFGNAVFSANAISNIALSYDNVSDVYAQAGNYLLSYGAKLSECQLFSKAASLQSTLINDSIVQQYPAARYDFNGQIYDWRYRGAYATCCSASGWQLQNDTMAQVVEQSTAVADDDVLHTSTTEFPKYILHRHQALQLELLTPSHDAGLMQIYSLSGRLISSTSYTTQQSVISIPDLAPGIYLASCLDEAQSRSVLLQIQE